MVTWEHYEQLWRETVSLSRLFAQAKSDGLNDIEAIRMLRQITGASLAEATQTMMDYHMTREQQTEMYDDLAQAIDGSLVKKD